jgi:[ribosomal protein S18]-alanine N-acetyltransferase
MAIHIGLATATDVCEVHALDQASFGVNAWSEESVRSELTGANRVALVARDDGELVGYAVTALNGDVLDLQRIAVAPHRRRSGLARSLFAVLLREGSRTRAQRMMLEVSAANEAGRAFYAERGLVEVARRPGYYRDGSDAVVMEMPLAPRDDEDDTRTDGTSVDLGEEWRRDG